MRDDTSLVEDAAAALHVALHRAEAWARIAAARGVLLGEASVALAALATFEGSYTYGDPATIQATNAAAQVRLNNSVHCLLRVACFDCQGSGLSRFGVHSASLAWSKSGIGATNRQCNTHTTLPRPALTHCLHLQHHRRRRSP